MSDQKDLTTITDLADRLEPRFEREVVRAADRLAAAVDLDQLTLALARQDIDGAMRIVVPDRRVRESMTPVRESIKSNLVRGGTLGADQVNRLRS